MLNQHIHNYKILSPLGQGGMATVYLCEHTLLGNKSAIKILNKEFIQNENIRKRFLAEARCMANMSNSNIAKVTDLIDDVNIVAFVMEYVDGDSLKEYIDHRGKLKNEEIKSLFLQMVEAVGYVHAQNLVHRDIKPSNFMIDKNGNVKLMDFGISKSTDKTSVEYTQTGTGVQMGTPMYMSPEQITETKSVTAQSDIYSLGVVLWQMVMGERPYDIKELSTFQLQMKIVQEELPKTNTHWDLIIHQATKKEIADRFTNCKAIIERINKNNSSEETVLLENFKVTKTILYSAEKTILANSTQKNLEHINEFEVSGIEIGNQLWMNKNLSQETFQNGDMLFFASNQSEWLDAINNKIPAYCFYNFNKDLSLKFGFLYNFHAVSDERNLAPHGWDIPTNKNWEEMINYFGGDKIAGAKMKGNLNKLWKEPLKIEFSAIKFDVLPSGFINQNGLFKNVGECAYFWSKDQFSENSAWNYYLLNFTSAISKTNSSKGSGLSVRCLKH